MLWGNDVVGCIFDVTKGIFCGLLFPNMKEHFPYSTFFLSMKKDADLLVKEVTFLMHMTPLLTSRICIINELS